MFELTGKVAIITGSGRGIGKATAQIMARLGAKVVVCSTSSSCERVRDEIRAEGFDATAVCCDIKSKDDRRNLIQTAVDTYGRIDILVNNAGITRDASMLKMKEEQWNEVLLTNLSAAFFLIKLAAPHIIAQGGGRIINVVSAAAQKGNFGQSNYSASKGGLISLTKTLAIELGSKNVTVNAVSPGVTDTDILRNVPEEVLQKMRKKIPLRRIGAPEEVGATIAFLASEEAGFITGHVLNVNGGTY